MRTNYKTPQSLIYAWGANDMSHLSKGAVVSTTMILTALVTFFAMWNAFNSNLAISTANQTASILQWQTDYGKKIDDQGAKIDTVLQRSRPSNIQ